MAYRSAFLKLMALSLGCAIGSQAPVALAGDGFTLATGRSTGKSYAVGVGISSLAKVKLQPLHKMDLSPVETEGFVQNVRMLQRNQAQFAILQAMFGHFARTGTGTFVGEAPRDDIQAIAMLWRDAEHFVINDDYVDTGTIADMGRLKDMPVSMGLKGPGSYESNRLLLSHFDVDVERSFDVQSLNYAQSSEALKDGQIKAMSTPIRPPAPHIQNALSSTDQANKLLEFTDEQIARADGGLGLWTRYVIPAATYPGQEKDIQTVAKSNLLVARKDVAPEVVYQITKAVFENLDFLRNIHDAMYETSVDRALVGMSMPLHPGALRYYQEIGLLGPDANAEVAIARDVKRAETTAFDPNGALLKASSQGTPIIPSDAAQLASTDVGIDRPLNSKRFVIYFGLGEKDVSGEALQEIAEISAYADNLTKASITISGHTDNSGDPVYNEYLAEVRAKSVGSALVTTFGASGHDIKIVNHGSTVPALNDNQEYQPRNRRVEITVVPSEQVDDQIEAVDVEKNAVPTWLKRASI